MLKKPVLGIIGGMGVQATACFYEKFYALQPSITEQEFYDCIIYSIPSTADRTAFISGKSTADPLTQIKHAAKGLEGAGASLLALLCITAHHFYDKIAASVNIPLMHIPNETAQHITGRGINSVGLLATDGTLKSGVFHDTLSNRGIDVFLPSKSAQADLMKLIYDIKLGVSADIKLLDNITADLTKSGVEAVILGCTELCVIPDDKNDKYINTLDVLAMACLKELNCSASNVILPKRAKLALRSGVAESKPVLCGFCDLRAE